MLPDIGGESGAKLVVALAAVAIALLLFYIVLRTWRQRGTRAFLRGGRNRRPRLAVVDAAAVDPRRRLVLVRRDDVEHLILIGGPSDVVVESAIGAPVSAGASETASAAGPHPQAAEARESFPAPDEGVATASRDAAGRRQEISSETAGDMRAAPANVPEPASSSAPRAPSAADPAAAAASSEIATILDSQRQRVFGPSEPAGPSPYERAYLEEDDDATPTAAPPQSGTDRSVLQFEDFLDTEVAGELAWPGPEQAGPGRRAATEPTAPGSSDPAAADPRSRTLDEEMSRLLQQLSRKR